MKNLYDENDRYTPDAQKLDDEAGNLIFPLMQKYINLGYSAREIAHVVCSSVGLIECELILSNPKKEKKNV